MINIATIDYYLEEENILNTTIDGDETLLDSDLVIIDTNNFRRLWEDSISTSNDGVVRVHTPYSDRVRNIFESRKNEIDTLLENGKIIVCFLSPVDGFLGERNNQRKFSVITNYDFLPVGSRLIENLNSGIGTTNSIKIKNHNLFSSYYSTFKKELNYSVYLDFETEDKSINFLVNRSNKPIGFILYERNGIIAFLPPVEYKLNNKKLISTLASITKKFLKKHVVTPSPNWVDKIKLNGEQEIDDNISKLNLQIQSLEDKKSDLINQKDKFVKYKALLYEQGPELEDAVINAFNLLGFNAYNRKLDDLEHDIVFESEEGKGIAEVEGKDNDAIHISKLDQLNRAVDEDFELNDEYAQGILIGNHYRFTKPNERKEPFTDKVLIVAKKKSFGLLTTIELYNAVEKIFANPDDSNLKVEFRKKILNTVGCIIKLV